MASKPVMDAVTARLAGWTATPIRDPNKTSATPSGRGAFLAVQYPVANEDQITFGSPGSNVFRESGAIRLVIHIGTGDGTEQASTWIEQLRALFRNQSFDGVRTYAPSPPVIDDSNEDGGWYRLSVAIPYDFDLLA
jgi:hypothetical protein